MKEVRDKERRLTETKSTARRSGREDAPPGSGDGGEGEGEAAAAKEKVRPVREREAEQANRTSLILRFTGPSTGYGPV